MAVAVLGIDYDEIRLHMAMRNNWHRTPGSWTSKQAADGALIIKSGLRRFYYPSTGYTWSFLRPRYDLVTEAPFSTGTVTIVNGVVTLAGGSWSAYSTNMTDAFFILNGARYTIASYNTTTQITLTDTTLNQATAATYELRWFRYSLPDNFNQLLTDFTFQPGEYEYHTVQKVDERRMRFLYQSNYVLTNDDPHLYAIYPKTFDDTVGQRWWVELWPESTAVQTLTARLSITPKDIDGTNKYPLGGGQHAETILEAILSECEIKLDDEPGVHTQKFADCLQTSILLDKRTQAPDYLPQMAPVGEMEDEDDFLFGYHRRGLAIYQGYEHLQFS